MRNILLLILVLFLWSCTELTNTNYYNDKIPVKLRIDNMIDGKRLEYCFSLWTLDTDPKEILCFNYSWLEGDVFKVYGPESGFCVTVIAYANGYNNGIPTHKSETVLEGPVIACDWGEEEYIYDLEPLVPFE